MPRQYKRRRQTSSDVDSNIKYITFSDNNERDLLFKRIQKLYDDEQFYDVTFRVQDRLFHSHKIILAASNTFLGGMLLSGLKESKQEIIELDSQTDPQLFRFILDYIYGKVIQVPTNLIMPLLKLSNCYLMINLRDRLAEEVRKTLHLENCCHVFEIADENGCITLKNHALELILNHFNSISRTNSFLNIPLHLLEQILQSDGIVDCDEALIFEAATKWIDNDKHSKLSNQIVEKVLHMIRFPLMDSCYLSDVIKNHHIITSYNQTGLLLEAFEHHALRAAGRIGLSTSRTIPRKQSCSFTKSTLLNGHQDSVSAMICYGEYLITGSWDTNIKIWTRSNINNRLTTRLSSSSLNNQLESNSIINLDANREDISDVDDDVSSINDNDQIDIEMNVDNNWDNASSSALPAIDDNDSWKCIKTLVAHSGAIRSLCICQGKVVSCSDDGFIMIWTPGHWTRARSMEGHDGAANAVIELVSKCYSNSNVLSSSHSQSSMDVNDDRNVVTTCRLVSAGDDGTIKLWNTDSWICEITLHNASDSSTTVSPLRVGVLSLEVWNHYLFSGGDDNVVRVWNTHDWSCVHLLRAHADEVWALRVLSDGQLVTGSVDGTIRVWKCCVIENDLIDTTMENISSVSPVKIHSRRNNRNNSSQLEQHQETRISSSDGPHNNIWLKSLHTWECEDFFSSDGPVYSLCCLDGRIVSAGASKRISVWKSSIPLSTESSNDNTREGSKWNLLKQFDTEEDGVWCLTIYMGHLISGGGAGTVRVWT